MHSEHNRYRGMHSLVHTHDNLSFLLRLWGLGNEEKSGSRLIASAIRFLADKSNPYRSAIKSAITRPSMGLEALSSCRIRVSCDAIACSSTSSMFWGKCLLN